jgi:hypothetical protein
MQTIFRTSTVLAIVTLLCTGVAAAQESEVSIETTLARDVVDRMPVDTGSAFSGDVGRIFLWTRVTGAAGESLSHVWIHGPHEAVVELNVGGSPWRTWSSRSINPEWTGEWKVEVRNAAGEVLKTVAFTVGSSRRRQRGQRSRGSTASRRSRAVP